MPLTKLSDPQAAVLHRMLAGETLTRGACWSFPDERRLHWDMMRLLEREGLIVTGDLAGGTRTYRLSHAGMRVLAAREVGRRP